ncbi:MAG TPA: glycosyltransferase [Vicinamibacteria bacterium]|nr:glycosyltransferase [Vicinamibacteria bacterium]
MRLAFVSPLPPSPTGIADHSADVLNLLSPRHEIDVFHAQDEVDITRLPPGCAVRRATELLERHRVRPYDVVVHQLGNAPAHAFQYGLLRGAAGLLVLHDLVLFHSRAATFLDSETVRAWRGDPSSAAARDAARPLLEAWRAELLYSYPAKGARLFEVHLGTIGALLPYEYPLFRIPVEVSRAVVVHNRYMARAVKSEVPEAEVAVVPQPAEHAEVPPEKVEALRGRLGFVPGDIVVGVFGLLTDEKRVDTIARVVARAWERRRPLRLLLVGPVPRPAQLEARLRSLGVRDRCTVTGRVPLEDLPTHLEAADVVAHLRHPGGRETSAALLRVLAQGRPTIVSDLEHLADLPDDAVRRIGLSDEEDALLQALLDLAGDPSARARLGLAAAAHARRAYGPERVRRAWERVLARVPSLPDPPDRGWPAHWTGG